MHLLKFFCSTPRGKDCIQLLPLVRYTVVNEPSGMTDNHARNCRNILCLLRHSKRTHGLGLLLYADA